MTCLRSALPDVVIAPLQSLTFNSHSWFLAIFGGASYVLVFMRSLTAISSKPTTSLTGTRSRLDKSIVPVVVTGGIRVEHFATVGEEFDVVLVPVSSSDLEKSVHLDRAAGQDEWK